MAPGPPLEAEQGDPFLLQGHLMIGVKRQGAGTEDSKEQPPPYPTSPHLGDPLPPRGPPALLLQGCQFLLPVHTPQVGSQQPLGRAPLDRGAPEEATLVK